MRFLAAAAVFGVTLAVGSPVFYLVLETFPSLIDGLGLYRIDHFGTIQAFLPDQRLVYRNRPPSYFRILNLRAANYSARHGIDLPLRPIPYRFGPDGFRNAAPHEFSEVVLLGDSMIEYGNSEEEILAAHVERLSGLSVTSFGVGGYGPFQYLELFKRYGVKKQPRYALFCFYEENDLGDIYEYLKWQREGRYYGFGILAADFWSRYRAAVKSSGAYIRARLRRAVGGAEPPKTLPDLAELRLKDNQIEMLLMDKVSTDSPQEMIESEGWLILKQIISEFRDVARAHRIVPMVVFIPLAANIYAAYSTTSGGANWLKARAEQIAAAGNAAEAMARLAQNLKIDLVDLTPAFKARAAAGEVLYYSYDQHWNSEGTKTAAAVIAAALTPERGPSGLPPSNRTISAAAGALTGPVESSARRPYTPSAAIQ